jgi:hypothetical protein
MARVRESHGAVQRILVAQAFDVSNEETVEMMCVTPTQGTKRFRKCAAVVAGPAEGYRAVLGQVGCDIGIRTSHHVDRVADEASTECAMAR